MESGKQASLSPSSPSTPTALTPARLRGNAYGTLGDAERKRDLLERALAIKEREYGPEHREMAVRAGRPGDAP